AVLGAVGILIAQKLGAIAGLVEGIAHLVEGKTLARRFAVEDRRAWNLAMLHDDPLPLFATRSRSRAASRALIRIKSAPCRTSRTGTYSAHNRWFSGRVEGGRHVV